jgi:hypothetical protein
MTALVHRDIKPENVIRDDATGRTLVLDFGIGFLDGEIRLTKVGQFLGTTAYLPPELIESGPVPDPRTDVYGIGCLGYFLLTGRKPFPDGPLEKVLIEKLRWTADDLRANAPDAPPRLVDVIARCMHPDADARYQSATGLLHALEDLQPRLTIYSLFRALRDADISTAWWADRARRAGFQHAPGDREEYEGVPSAHVFFLLVWLQALGLRRVDDVVRTLKDLELFADDILREVVAACPRRPPAIGTDVVRLVLGVHHRLLDDHPELRLDEDPVSLVVNRLLAARPAAGT